MTFIFKIFHSIEKETNIYWLDQLFNYYGEELLKDSRYLAYEDFFSTNEQVFIIKIGSLEVGFFLLCTKKNTFYYVDFMSVQIAEISI